MQNDRTRLMEVLKKAEDEWANSSKTFKEAAVDNILADGWIRLPCKIGETLYLIQIDFKGNYNLSECLVGSKITMLSILRAREEQTVVYMSTNKAEAEEKLKELEGNK